MIKNPRHAATLAYAIVALDIATIAGDKDKIYLAQVWVKAVEAKIRETN